MNIYQLIHLALAISLVSLLFDIPSSIHLLRNFTSFLDEHICLEGSVRQHSWSYDSFRSNQNLVDFNWIFSIDSLGRFALVAIRGRK